jgi:hypothetical protein
LIQQTPQTAQLQKIKTVTTPRGQVNSKSQVRQVASGQQNMANGQQQ